MRIVAKTLTVALGLSVCGITGYLVYMLLKRDEEDDYIDPLEKASKFRVIEVPIPSELVKVVIGRGGRNIKQIEEQSNTKINFKEKNGVAESVCVVRGSVEACNIAENLIREFIENQPVIDCEDMFVPAHAVGRIIGRDGDRIREVCLMSGAKVNVDGTRSSAPRRVLFRGTKEQILVAKSIIQDIIEESERKQAQVDAALARREPRVPLKNGDSLKPVESPKVERMSPVPGQPDSQFEVYVSAMVDPSRFWVQIVGPKATQLDLLVDEMTEYYGREENRRNHTLLNGVDRGDLVAAVFQYDTKWYRAEVLSVQKHEDSASQAELYFVDYGDTDVVPIDELFELRTDFLKLRFQAIECYLARVEPAEGDSWSLEAIDKFEEWTHVAQWQKLTAKINGHSNREKTRAKRETSPVPGLDLYDVTNEQDIDVAQELVNHKFAVFKKEAELTNSRATSISNISQASSS